MECRVGCGACCIAASLNRPFYGMPQGKKAGERCVHLDAGNLCRLFGDPRRPAACIAFEADESVCGSNFEQALERLRWMEGETLPHNKQKQ